MTKEEYKEYSECMIFLQLSLMSKQDLLNGEGINALLEMQLDGWNLNRTNNIISVFINQYGEL